MNVTGPENLPGQNKPCPHVLIGDEVLECLENGEYYIGLSKPK